MNNFRWDLHFAAGLQYDPESETHFIDAGGRIGSLGYSVKTHTHRVYLVKLPTTEEAAKLWVQQYIELLYTKLRDVIQLTPVEEHSTKDAYLRKGAKHATQALTLAGNLMYYTYHMGQAKDTPYEFLSEEFFWRSNVLRLVNDRSFVEACCFLGISGYQAFWDAP